MRTIVHALSREISDHTPLFLNTEDTSSRNNPSLLKFELGWLLREGFGDRVKDTWQSVQEGHTALERWQAKIRRLPQYLRGWAKNISGAYKKENNMLLNKLDELDKKAETILLDENDLNLKHVLNARLRAVKRRRVEMVSVC